VPALAAPSPTALFAVMPWVDPNDGDGYDPRSPYVEQFWLGLLGPTTTFLLRLLVDRLDEAPDGYELDVAQTATALGLTSMGPNGPFARAFSRCVQFGLAQPHSHGLLVRRRVPPLSNRQVLRLPPGLQAKHRASIAGAASEEAARRARHLAAALVDLGDDAERVERELQRLAVPPAVASSAVAWACRQRDLREARRGAAA
jgi:hypothetical protein